MFESRFLSRKCWIKSDAARCPLWRLQNTEETRIGDVRGRLDRSVDRLDDLPIFRTRTKASFIEDQASIRTFQYLQVCLLQNWPDNFGFSLYKFGPQLNWRRCRMVRQDSSTNSIAGFQKQPDE